MEQEERIRRRRAAAARQRRRRRLALGVAAGSVVILVGAWVAFARPRHEGAIDAVTPEASAVTTPAPPVTTAPAPQPEPEPAPVDALTLPAAIPDTPVTVPVLMYHRVAPASTATNAVSADLTVTPQDFRAQMAWLAREGYTPISQVQLFRAMMEGDPLPARPLVLTFDDGYVDMVDEVLPVLQRRGWPATMFVITSRIGQPAFLTWPQIERLDAAGMEVASHTVDHVELPTLDPAERERQLVESRRVLEKRLGHMVRWFCYPVGRYDDASAQAVADAGYFLAFTTEPGSSLDPSSRTTLPRVRISGGMSLDAFADTVSSASAT